MKSFAVVLAIYTGLGFCAHAEDAAITNARIFTGDMPTVIENGTVLIRSGRIEAVGENLPLPDETTVIDAGGAWLTPGFMNGATQIGLIEMGSVGAANDAGLESGTLGADFDISYAINPNSTLIPLALADGLTLAVSLPQRSAVPPFTGLPCVLHFDGSPDIIVQPRAAVAASIGGGSSSSTGGSRAAQWILLRRALDMAAQPSEDDGQEPGDQDLAKPFLRQVLDRQIPLALALDRESDIRQAVALSEDYDIRLVLIGAAEAWRVADKLAEHEIGVVINPILNLPESFDALGARNTLARDLSDAGVAFAFMSYSIHYSYNAGLGIREAAGTAVAHGLSWREALRGLTIYPAQMWGLGKAYGLVAPGYHADLVLWDGDPLEPASRAMRVWVDGKEADLVTRQDLLARRYIERLAIPPSPTQPRE